MAGQPGRLGCLILLLVAGTACAAVRPARRPADCSSKTDFHCSQAGAGSGIARYDFRLDARWKAPESDAGFGGPEFAANPATAAAGAQAGDANASDFSPGQSTGTAQHLVEWTLIAAPIGAYALSPLIDHRLTRDDSGIWKRSRQLDLEYAVGLTELGGAFWLGGNNRLGRTFWKSIDSSLYTAVTVQAMKYAFSRSRPYQANNPNLWFQGNCCQSFPSGEVSFQASFVTPFIAEYYKQDPWIWALEALPAYDAVARMKAQGHWQTDVLAAWAIGTAWGLYAHFEPKPLVLSFMPDGVMVGLHVHF